LRSQERSSVPVCGNIFGHSDFCLAAHTSLTRAQLLNKQTKMQPDNGAMEIDSKQIEVLIMIISDSVCPWCFVAKRKLEQAMKFYPNIKFIVDWVPYFLVQHETEFVTETVSSRLCLKYGEERGMQMLQALQKAGESVNISWSDRRFAVNTTLSHALIKIAKTHNLQNEVMDAIFRAYFENCVDIRNLDFLVAIGRQVGLDEFETRQFLENPNTSAEIQREAEEIRLRYKVSGVPAFIMSRSDKKGYKLKLHGAQPVEVFAAAFKRISEL